MLSVGKATGMLDVSFGETESGKNVQPGPICIVEDSKCTAGPVQPSEFLECLSSPLTARVYRQ